MFLLTKDQANAMTTDTRKCSQASEANYNYWWLCSPGSFGNFASCVYGGNGNVLAYGYSVVYAVTLRRACTAVTATCSLMATVWSTRVVFAPL